MSPLILYHLIFLSYLSAAVPQQQPYPNRCGERCGGVVLPFPFHLNSSCGPAVDAFRLSCRPPDSGLLYLSLAPSADLRVLGFLPSGSLLLDYSSLVNSSSPCDRWYADVGKFPALGRSPFFAVTAGNVLRLYDCEDSSICREGCEAIGGGACGGSNRTDFGCCYPLSDGSAWKAGDGFSAFAEFGCRGFSSWFVNRSAAVRGIEVEWAVPRGSGGGAVDCAEGAVVVNATAVHGGVRCACGAGYVGDGFAQGAGCFKDCSGDGQVTDSRDCCKGRFCTKRAAALAGVSVSAFFLAAAVVFCFLLRQPVKDTKWDFDPACLPKILGKACNTRQFTYEELNEATKGFEDQKLVDFVDRSVHTGVLYDGSVVAVQKVNCETQEHLRQVLERVEILSQISHRNIARIIGFCFDSNNVLLLVHEHFSNGTLREHIRRERGNSLSWYLRVNVASEVAGALAYLQSQVAIPINLNDLKSSEILVDVQYAAKIAGYKLITSQFANGSCSYTVPCDSDVVRNFGRLLMELITGSEHEHTLEMVSSKVKDGKVHEIVDSSLIHGERQLVENEVERVASLAARCLSRRENGGPCMFEVAKELLGIGKENIGSSSRIEITLEETFSNSSLLQMISMSPESMRIQ
ncbi:probably inactive receptor-like protein kinase At2g46850 [Ananas comosus]|uniref:Probably inactive receptor-like protein kinase At2g46850 n=1 Tax=Ananas comosus TaxID=4615 RepID=A0A6P5EUQ2_ANACO|nr:probably inactive receptor-like protein kinase At2g46850 [Ananas comosus]